MNAIVLSRRERCLRTQACAFSTLPDDMPADRSEALAERVMRLSSRCTYAVASHDPAAEGFDASRYWNGPVWLIVNYMIADGLRRGGQTDVAEKIKHDSLELIEKGGFAE